jgi:hypothetical protein
VVVVGPKDCNDGLEGIVKGSVIAFHSQSECVLDALGLLVVYRLSDRLNERRVGNTKSVDI